LPIVPVIYVICLRDLGIVAWDATEEG